jgi:hypothetical protein
MTPHDPTARVLEGFGYTARQAQFLALVAVHGGYFLRRQFVAFTGRAHGLAAVRFVNAAVRRSHVRVLPYGRQGSVFHLCARPLYAALGQEHNRNRRAAEWDAVVRKLMTLDFVLAHPAARFLATEGEKVDFLRERNVPRALWPSREYASTRAGSSPTIRYFVDKMPWLRDADHSRLWIAYVDAEVTLRGFQTFLEQYQGLLGAVPSGVVYAGPTPWSGPVQHVFDKVIVGANVQCHDATAFQDYCELRSRIEANDWAALGVADLQRYRGLEAAFKMARLDVLYERWRQAPDAPVDCAEIVTPRHRDCVLRIHALSDRYRVSRRTTTARRG